MIYSLLGIQKAHYGSGQLNLKFNRDVSVNRSGILRLHHVRGPYPAPNLKNNRDVSVNSSVRGPYPAPNLKNNRDVSVNSSRMSH